MGHLRDRVRVRRRPVQSFAVRDLDGHTLWRASQCQSRRHSASLEKLQCIYFVQFICAFPREIHVFSHPPQPRYISPVNLLKLAHSLAGLPYPAQYRYTYSSSKSSSLSAWPRSRLCKSVAHQWHPMDVPAQSRHLLGSSSCGPGQAHSCSRRPWKRMPR
jgi:hypothetical protein